MIGGESSKSELLLFSKCSYGHITKVNIILFLDLLDKISKDLTAKTCEAAAEGGLLYNYTIVTFA